MSASLVGSEMCIRDRRSSRGNPRDTVGPPGGPSPLWEALACESSAFGTGFRMRSRSQDCVFLAC
eukprot:13112211-Alexandrium_andersonii.AAC.1